MARDDNRLARLERALGVTFKDRTFLRQALTHPSLLNERPVPGQESYERLEFLGDSLLGWIIASELFKRFPNFSEGDLTIARASLVQGKVLTEVAKSLNLGDYLYMGQGEKERGGRNQRSNLEALLEAVLGAVFLDQGEAAARSLALDWLGKRLDDVHASGATQDAKTALQILTQQQKLPLPQYSVVKASGPPHKRTFMVEVRVNGNVLGQGAANRKSDAEQAAAAEALERLSSKV